MLLPLSPIIGSADVFASKNSGRSETGKYASRSESNFRRGMGHAIVVEDGEAANYVIERFRRRSAPFVVISECRERIAALHAIGVCGVHGDATQYSVLSRARVVSARRLVIAVTDLVHASRIVSSARRLNPRLILTDASSSGLSDLLHACRVAELAIAVGADTDLVDPCPDAHYRRNFK